MRRQFYLSESGKTRLVPIPVFPAKSLAGSALNRISFTSMSSGWLIAKATALANESAGMAIS